MKHKTFMPIIGNGPTPVPAGGQVEPDKARLIFDRMRGDPAQTRRGMTWDADLARAALSKCKSQATDGWEGHTDPQGHGPNYLVRHSTRYKLPDYSHDDDANTIESLAHSGDGSIDRPRFGVWPSWMGSEGHRRHILGLEDTYRDQTSVGVAYYFLESSIHRHYWCVLTVEPEVTP